MGTIIHMAASAVPADAMASIDVPKNGKLVGVDWAVDVAASGADFSERVQVSFGSVGAFVVNDSRQVISDIKVSADLTTSGVAVTHANKYVALPDLDVAAGERIYMHATGTANSIHTICDLHFDFDLDRPRARLR